MRPIFLKGQLNSLINSRVYLTSFSELLGQQSPQKTTMTVRFPLPANPVCHEKTTSCVAESVTKSEQKYLCCEDSSRIPISHQAIPFLNQFCQLSSKTKVLIAKKNFKLSWTRSKKVKESIRSR